MRPFSLCTLLVIFLTNPLFAQKLSNSELNTQCVNAFEWVAKQSDTTRYFLFLKQLEKKVGTDEVQLAILNKHRGNIYSHYGMVKESFQYLNKAYVVFEQHQALCFMGKTKIGIAGIYQMQTDYENASINLEKAKQYLEKCDQEDSWIGYYTLKGSLALDLKDTTEAKSNFLNAIKLAEKYRVWEDLGGNQYNMGLLSRKFKKLQDAIKWFNLARETQQKYGYNQGLVLNQLTQIYIDYLQDFKTAEPLVWQQIKELERKGGASVIKMYGTGYIRLGEIYLNKHDYPNALKAYTKAMEQTSASGLPQLKLQGVEGMATYYDAIGDSKKAFQYLLEAYYLSRDVLYKSANEKMQQKEVIYNITAKNKEIEVLAKEKALQNVLLLMSILALVTLIAVVYFLLKQSRLQKKIKMIEQEKLEANLSYSQRELTSLALYMDQRNEFLGSLRDKVIADESKKNILKEIDNNISLDTDWQKFKIHFEQVHPLFFEKLSRIAPALTDLDQKQCAYIVLNFDSKQVSNLLNVTPHAVRVSRSRIKKKLGLSEADSLRDYLLGIF